MEAGPWRILVAESRGFSPRAGRLLEEAGAVRFADLDRPALLAAVGEADVLWTRLGLRIDREVLDAAPDLRVIVTPTTGLNHVDTGEAARRGVDVLSLRGETAFLRDVRATAEHTVGLMLALLRRIPAAVAHVHEGGWSRDLFRGRELRGATVGLVGYGRLGRLVARSLAAFDATVLAADPAVDPAAVEPPVSLVGAAELLERTQILSLHADLNETSHDLIGAAELAALPPGAVLVNTARGELVDEDALLRALESGRLAGAALDVLRDELGGDLGSRPLVRYAREHDNLLITPHIGGLTAESLEKTEGFMAERLVARLAGARR